MATDTTSPTFKSICQYISTVPKVKMGNGRAWRSDPQGVAVMVHQIMLIGGREACRAIAKECGMSEQTLHLFCRGLSPSYSVWLDLRAELTKLGVQWESPASNAPVDVAPVAVAPVAVAVAPVAAPPAKLAVTNTGDVVAATPPRSMTQPSTMAAKPGSYVTSSTRHTADASGITATTTTSTFAIEQESQDIIVTTTTRLRYGTAEHRAKMRDVMLQLGTRRA